MLDEQQRRQTISHGTTYAAELLAMAVPHPGSIGKQGLPVLQASSLREGSLLVVGALLLAALLPERQAFAQEEALSESPLLFDLGPLKAIPANFQVSALSLKTPPQAAEHPSPGPADVAAGSVESVQAPTREPPSLDVFVDTRFLFLTGFVAAREHTTEGNRFPFRDLHADFGENIGIGGRWSITPKDRLELRLAYFNLRGTTTLGSGQVFNNTTLVGGTTLESKPDWLEFRLTYLRELFSLPSLRSSFWFLFGVDYHYIHWRFGATISPTTHGHEPGEDFDRQTFPLPVFGLRYLLELSPEWSFDLRADAFRANHWRHWADEGGPIHTSSTIVDVIGVFRWQPEPWFFVEAGYTFNYYTLDETGPEDGNHLLAREHGPLVSIGLSW
jgi:hypothetical protein